MGVKAESVDGKEWAQILAILLASLVSMTGGILFSWPSPSITVLLSPDYPLDISLEEVSYFSVLPPIAAVITAFPISRLVDVMGRRNGLLFVAVPHFLCWILIGIEHSIWTFYAARFLNGFADSFLFASLPVYIGEVASPKVRGSWGNAITFSLFFGGMLINVVGAYCSIRTTAYIFGSIPLIFFATFWFMPETPYFLLIKGKEEEAKRSLRWLRQTDNIEEEFKEISIAVKREMAESGTMKDLFCTYTNRKAVIIGGVMRFSQQFSGISAFIVYSQYLFKEAGGEMAASTAAIICAGVMAVVSLIGSALLDVLGRRKSIFISGIGCEIVLLLMGTFMYLNLHMDLSMISWFPVLGMIVFIVLFTVGFGIVPTLMLGELFSSSIKGKALAMMNVFFGIFIASSTKIFQVLYSEYGLYAPFFFYAACCLIGSIACYFLVPETKGKTLDEIQQQIKGTKKVGTIKDTENYM